MQSKKQILMGVSFILASILCALIVFYLLVNQQSDQTREIKSLKDQVTFLSTEKSIAESQIEKLGESIGKSIKLNKLLKESKRLYGRKERTRTEGYLYVDNDSDTLVVTLGALNGVEKGSKLTIYDGESQVGFVRVDTPMDVISYVRPINKKISDFVDTYYRAVIE